MTVIQQKDNDTGTEKNFFAQSKMNFRKKYIYFQ